MHATKMRYILNTKLLLHMCQVLKKNTVNAEYSNRMTSLILHVRNFKLYFPFTFKVSIEPYQ